jgi:hypothetical protein
MHPAILIGQSNQPVRFTGVSPGGAVLQVWRKGEWTEEDRTRWQHAASLPSRSPHRPEHPARQRRRSRTLDNVNDIPTRWDGAPTLARSGRSRLQQPSTTASAIGPV